MDVFACRLAVGIAPSQLNEVLSGGDQVNRWFRFYSEALEDPKVQRLDGETFKAWINILCLANRTDGLLPSLADIAFALRTDENGARSVVDRLHRAVLLDRISGGPEGYRYVPHAWRKRQYKSDTSTERVKRFRQRSKSVAETAPESESESGSETDSETDQKEVHASRHRMWACPNGVDSQHWRDFLMNRRTKRLTNSKTAHEGQLKALAELADDEWPPGRLVQHAAEKGWATICDPRTPRYGARRTRPGMGIGRTEAAAIAALGGSLG